MSLFPQRWDYNCAVPHGPDSFYVCSGARTQILLFVRQTLSPLSRLPGPTLVFNMYNVCSSRYFRKTYLVSWVLTTCFLIYIASFAATSAAMQSKDGQSAPEG